MKNKKIAALLSLLFPGLGHFYLGQYVDGIVLTAGAGVLWYTIFKRPWYLTTFDNPRCFLVWGALIIIYLLAIVDSYRKTK